MKKKWLKIAGVIIGGIAGLVLIGCLIYVYLYYPRPAEPFEIKADNPVKRILIATQGSDFKNILVKDLCDSLKKSPVYIKGVDVGDLKKMNDRDWDRILIVNSFLVWINRNVDRFISSADDPDKILLVVTSGGNDWLPKSDLKVDAFTAASRKEYVKDLGRLIVDWLEREDVTVWKPEDYLLSLQFFPRADVKTACSRIAIEQEHYRSKYPNLVNLINGIGYRFLHIEDVDSAIDVFKLNVNLFPDHWNVYDSYGETLLRGGDREGAIVNYRKALELNPDSQSARNMLKKLTKNL